MKELKNAYYKGYLEGGEAMLKMAIAVCLEELTKNGDKADVANIIRKLEH